MVNFTINSELLYDQCHIVCETVDHFKTEIL